ncbi:MULTISPECIES: hypothetical protein [unclassified Actinotalea]|uniref:hypothetical protein n=1 Tax=unclassified Actinotalea TaxID=2638618 RepID=UPI0015F4AEDA|nr:MULTISPECIES: hypothetical protein [unclassified Actinotalea]
MQPVFLALGGVLTLTGAFLLVRAFRLGQADDQAGERATFRLAVGALALGSLLFLATAVLTEQG